MRSIDVKDNQCLVDIALEHCGTIEAAYDIAELNGLELTATLTTGQVLLVPDVTDEFVVATFEPHYLYPNSADNDLEASSVNEGIGYWLIEIDNEVQ